ncbi:hypothetical protein RND81_06G029100 [Saponaria officinalis]|uniref:S-protein homolog n=1 Tax=Saponaria officinalis TaxID=3572 RepID=A0AAW1K892_SAPOF
MGYTIKNTLTLILFIQVILQIVLLPAHAGEISLETYHIVISNGLKPGQAPVVVHCKSRDDDLGSKPLNRPGDIYAWHFTVNYSASTLYFCHFYWNDKDISFDTFNFGIAFKCKESENVYWDVREDGFYSSCELGRDWVMTHSWTN